MRVLVIPSNRGECLREFLAAWEGRGGWDTVYLIEDNPERTFDVKVDRHFAWNDLKLILGSDAWIFSKRDSAIRCFGFLAAWHAGADHVLTLDDDCFPPHGENDFLGEHVQRLTHARWASTVPGLRVRGLPYRNRGELQAVANVGLWTGHPDFDAATVLSCWGRNATPRYALPHANWLLPRGQYAPLCGMNLCLAHAALPLFYFPLMGEGQPYARFDDIWAGVIAKKICDHLGWFVSIGEPFVEHRRASDPFVNLVKEAPGIAANEDFWQAIDAVPLTGTTPLECVRELGLHLVHDANEYRARLGQALGVWARLFLERPVGL